MNFTILPASQSDLAGISAIENACFSLPWAEDILSRAIAAEDAVFLCAVLDSGGTIGYVSAQTVLDEGYIGNVAVAPEYRRNGVADALITALKELCADRLAFLTLEVRVSNIPAIALYEKQGFKKLGERRNYYEKPRENALIMTYFYGKEAKEC